jgi:hypothetical protein
VERRPAPRAGAVSCEGLLIPSLPSPGEICVCVCLCVGYMPLIWMGWCSFTASVSAILVNIPQKQAAYNASKAAQVHLAKSLAVEWADFARVNCISPVG